MSIVIVIARRSTLIYWIGKQLQNEQMVNIQLFAFQVYTLYDMVQYADLIMLSMSTLKTLKHNNMYVDH